MPWVYRKRDEHVCKKPSLVDSDVHVGDIWECDDATCMKRWIVREDQRDGRWFEQTNQTSPQPGW